MTKLAVLIDADNTSAQIARELFEEIAKYGIAGVKKIYGDWTAQSLLGWQKILLKYALTPIQQFAYTKGKDATDMKLIIDAMDLLYSKTFDGFCLVSSDSDFTPLASRIRESGLIVYGFGRKNTPEAFRHACDKFIYVENLGVHKITLEEHLTTEDSKQNEKTTAELAGSVLQQPIEGALRHLLNKAVKDNTDDATGWASVSQIGSYLSQTQSDFDPRTYGYSKLSAMLKKLGGLQFRTEGGMFCRKIPYSEFLKLLTVAMTKFADKNGTAAINALEKYLTPRFSYQEYGFSTFESFIETVSGIQINGERLSMAKKEK